MYEPAVKWSGSKRSQAKNIIKYFPKEIDTYYEPFCGGCSVLRRLLDYDTIKVKHYVCSDLNEDLINLWQMIKNDPLIVSEHYNELWHELNKDDDKDRKKAFFYQIRDRLNIKHDPLDFMFIMRTTTNGMPRYNDNGDFNNSFHVTRNGIIPNTLKKILVNWSDALNKHDVEFRWCSYDEIKPESTKDFLYLDPPYAHTKGMFFGKLVYSKFYDWLRGIQCEYAFSFDGISGRENNTIDVPMDIYTRHEYIYSGNSSFKRVIGNNKDSIVYESLYLK